ncbi:MAG: DUF481 domain-containing protein [Sphingobium sp.]|nr:DUF481 domain-containing protein [Sphingobium sp.]MCP5399549.1 DUF481 domain-containing protein [Sphingomonas sp.]
MPKYSLIIPFLLAASPAIAQEETVTAQQEPAIALPAPIRQMLEAAMAGEDEAEIEIVAKYARQAAPLAEAEIDAMLAQHQEQMAAKVEEKRSNPNIFALWAGKLELGGFRSTGSTSEFGFSGTLTAKRQGLMWTHTLYGSADYRRANGETSRERFLASYIPRYRLDERGFIYGLVQYERDPTLGFESRYTGSVGVGYKVIDEEMLKFAVEAGPSLRRAHYTDDGTETKAGVRSSAELEWQLSPTLTFHQTGSAYAEKDVMTLASLTALDAKLISILTARLSYDVLYEKDDKLTEKKLDTLSKVSLIYEF